MRRLLVLVALTPLLLADTCGGQNACNHPPVEVGGQVTVAQAATDPCVGQPPLHVVAWYTRGDGRYPLRCGRRDPKGYGYLHIRYDEGGHGDAANDPTFSAEIANTLARGVEGIQGGGNYRYTVKYNDAQSACFRGAWGFRVVLAKARLCLTGVQPASSPRCTTRRRRPCTHNRKQEVPDGARDRGRPA